VQGGEIEIGATSIQTGAASIISWKPSDHVSPHCGGSPVILELRATDKHGDTGMAPLQLTVAYQPC
jgi:hypothetical protein